MAGKIQKGVNIVLQIRLIVLTGSLATLIACSGSGNLTNEASLLTEEQLAVFVALGLRINEGDTPPDITGTYRIDPRLLSSSSAPEFHDLVETTFPSQNITFAKQGPEALTASVTEDGNDGAGFGDIVILGSTITGTNNAFTTFQLSQVTFNGHIFEIAQAFSGNVAEGGIKNFQQANSVIDGNGDPGNHLIPDDTGNLFTDLDGITSRVTEAAVADAK